MSAAEGASDMERRDLVLQGWDIDHKDIEIAKHDDGSEWLLGAGSYGKARRFTTILQNYYFTRPKQPLR